MSASASLIRGLAFNDQMLDSATEGFALDDWLHRPEGGGNHAQWLLGHLAATRRYAARLAGAAVEEVPWEQLFGQGAQPGGPADDVAPEMLREAYRTVGRELRERLEDLGPQAGDKPLAKPFPDGSDTVDGALHFLYMHEVYHLGQLGLLRRMAGKAGTA